MRHVRTQAGFALVPVMLILALLMALAVALNTSVIMDQGLNAGYNRATAGFYAAESGLDVAMDSFRNKFLLYQLPSTSDFTLQNFTLGTRTVNYQLQDPGGNPTLIQVPAGHMFAGLNSVQYTYLVNSQSLNGGITEASVGAQFNIQNIPLFQFLAFYAGDLEILPGANMTMHGRVHTNGELYLNSDASLTITTNPPSIPIVQISSKGSIHRGRKDSTACGGTVQVMSSGASPTLKTMSCIGTTSAVVPTPTLAAWNGSMVSGVKSITVPTPGIMGPGGMYWNNADLRIALQLNPNGQGPHSIVVLAQDGSVDTLLTPKLTQFINDVSFNTTKSDFKGTKPIFFTDVPLATPGPGCSCNLNTYPPTGCSANAQLNCYWGTPLPTFTPTATPANTWNATTTRTQPPTATATPTPTQGTPTPTFNNDHAFSNLDRIYSSNTWTNSLTPTPSYPIPGSVGSMYRDNDPRRGGFYNWREKKWMYLLNINLRDLLQWNIDQKAATGSWPFGFDPSVADANNTDPTHTAKGGPVIYLTVYVTGALGAAGQNNYGVRIFGGNPLPFPTPANPGDPTGITVVSDQAVYVAGDYNLAGTYTIGGTSASYIKEPAAIMGDSVNVLSNTALVKPTPPAAPGYTPGQCINDCQSTLTLNSRPATASGTTINAAFIGGVDVTNTGTYNGGLENYFRFHETWSGDNLNYRGSFVSLGTPNHVNGTWCGTGGSSTSSTVTGCNIYNPPNRNYDYDSDFNDVKNLPPMTPRFVYVQQIVFTENFN
jgi:hypothetical protein